MMDPRQMPEHGLEEEPKDRYRTVLAWGPAILMVLALIFLAARQVPSAIILAVGAILFWIILRRRRSRGRS